MVISIHQPDYIPWLGFYYKMAHCDKFVYLDDAQFSNTAAHNFNVIKVSQGELRLKIPVDYKMGDKINNVRTKDELGWKKKHLKTIEYNYSKAPFFKKIFPELSDIYNDEYKNIADFNIRLNAYICDGFGIAPEIYRSSDLNINSAREERVLDICSALGGDEYLSGNGARAYQVEEHFTDRNIKLTYLDYKPIVYEQLWGDFLPCMSVLDYLFNKGFDWNYVEDCVKQLNTQE
ncbi:MAG: WbqC family protein [Clostridia bacterium]|nr:WbqC family protein [Clostridia bacterium]